MTDSIGTRRAGGNGPSGPSFAPECPEGPPTFAYPPAVAKVAQPAPRLEWDTPLYQQARTQLEHAFAEAIALGQHAGRVRAGEIYPLALNAWASVHGAAMLLLDGHLDLLDKPLADLPFRLDRAPKVRRLHRSELLDE